MGFGSVLERAGCCLCRLSQRDSGLQIDQLPVMAMATTSRKRGSSKRKAPLQRAALLYIALSSREGVKPDVVGLLCPMSLAVKVTICNRSAVAHG